MTDHDARVLHQEDGWQAVCSCGYEGDVRDDVDAATEDRFAHEAEVDEE